MITTITSKEPRFRHFEGGTTEKSLHTQTATDNSSVSAISNASEEDRNSDREISPTKE